MVKRPWMVFILLGCLVLSAFSPVILQPGRGWAQVYPANLLAAQMPVSQAKASQVTIDIEGQIAYVATDGNLWVLRQGENIPFPMTSDANPERVYLSPRWSPDGSLLAFCRQDGGENGKSGLYFVRTGEWQPFPLAQDIYCQDWLEGSFTWSPDGRQIVYARNFVFNPQAGGALWESYYGLWSVDLLTNETVEFLPASNGNPLVHPQWSPDGKWLKYYEVAYIEGLGVLHTWEVGTGKLVNWVDLGADIFPGFSSWASDGTRIIFDVVSYTGFPGAGIYQANPDGSDIQLIFSRSNRVATKPSLSPRRDRVAFLLSEYGQATNTLVVTDLAGESAQEIVSSEAGLAGLDWSPAGSQLLFALPSGEAADLVVFNVDTGDQTVIAQAKPQQVDWGPYSAGSTTREALSPQTIPEVSYKPNLLIYLAEDYRLVLLDPSKERQIDLSPPMTIGAYQASPSRQGLVYRDRWMWLSFEAGGNLGVQGILLPSAPAQGQISWSPDESRLAMQDAQGRVWLAARSGAFVEVPGAASLPTWSFDGQWLSYCNSANALWVVGPGTPPLQIADQIECPARWSSRGYLLAYTLTAQSTTPQVYVYDPLAGKNNFVSEGARLIDWSPDGRLLALVRPDATAGRRIIFSVDPLSGKQLLAGRFLQNETGPQTWFPQSGSYLFGPYRLTPDLFSASRVADAVYAATSQSGRLLVGIGTSELITLSCLEPAAGQSHRLATANLAGYKPGLLPGVWGEISSDGEWAAAYVYDRGRYQALLSRCDGTAQLPLSDPVTVVPGEFSPNSQWYLERQIVAGASKLVVRDLTENITQTLATADHKLGLWIKPLPVIPPGGYSLTGRLEDDRNKPLEAITLLLDGLPAGVSNEDGRFSLHGLPPGEYTLSPQSDEYYFEPSDEFVRLPSDEVDFEFSGFSIESGIPPDVLQPEEEVPDEGSEGDLETGEAQPGSQFIPSGNPFILLPWICGGGLVLLVFLLFAGVIRAVRRRRKRRAEILPEPESPVMEDDTAPVRVQPSEALLDQTQKTKIADRAATLESKSVPQEETGEERLQSWLGEGVQLVRQGQLARGAEALRKVVEADADNATAWMWLGWAAAKSGDRQLAVRCFRRAKQLGHPRAEQALIWLRKTG